MLLLEQYKDKPWMQERLSKFAYDVHMLTQMQPFAAINYIRHGIGYDEFLEKYAEERKMDGQELIELLDELQDSARIMRRMRNGLDILKNIQNNCESRPENSAKRRRMAWLWQQCIIPRDWSIRLFLSWMPMRQ